MRLPGFRSQSRRNGDKHSVRAKHLPRVLRYSSTHGIHDDIHLVNDSFKRRGVIVNRLLGAKRANELDIARRRRADDTRAFPSGEWNSLLCVDDLFGQV